MASVAAGSRLLVHGERGPLTLRNLRAVELTGGWAVPVLGDVAALEAAGLAAATALVEFPTEHGPLRLNAELVCSEGVFLLRAPALRTAALIEQRRENVRGVVHLPLRGTLLSVGAARTRSPGGTHPGSRSGSRSGSSLRSSVRGGDDGAGVALSGVTRTVSGGGISADLRTDGGFAPRTGIYVELELPGGDLAPAVMAVLQHDGPLVRASFVDISALDRERLVRLVFTRQRAELADRRRAGNR